VLIYARNVRRFVEAWAARFAAGWRPHRFHVPVWIRRARLLPLEHFQQAPPALLVATVAFGMGVDRCRCGWSCTWTCGQRRGLPAGVGPGGTRNGCGPVPGAVRSGRIAPSLGWANAGLDAASSRRRGRSQERTPPWKLAQQQLRRMEAVAEGSTCASRPLSAGRRLSFVPPAVAVTTANAAAVPPIGSLEVARCFWP